MLAEKFTSKVQDWTVVPDCRKNARTMEAMELGLVAIAINFYEQEYQQKVIRSVRKEKALLCHVCSCCKKKRNLQGVRTCPDTMQH